MDVIDIRYFKDGEARILKLDRYRNFISDEVDGGFAVPLPAVIPEQATRAARVIVRPVGSSVIGVTFEGIRKIADCPNCPKP